MKVANTWAASSMMRSMHPPRAGRLPTRVPGYHFDSDWQLPTPQRKDNDQTRSNEN
ncbi:MAG: hypothetical protein R3A10_04785 [Caldilineaceae bacterium]